MHPFNHISLTFPTAEAHYVLWNTAMILLQLVSSSALLTPQNLFTYGVVHAQVAVSQRLRRPTENET